MEEAICLHPGCHARIGGHDHVPVKGNVRLDANDLNDDSPVGYVLEAVTSTQGDDCSRISRLSCRIMRLFMHLALLAASYSAPSSLGSSICSMMFPRSEPSPLRAMQELRMRLYDDWNVLLRLTGFCDGDLALMLHSVICRIPNMQQHSAFKSAQARDNYEIIFEEQCIRPIFGGNIHNFLAALRLDLQEANKNAHLGLSLGEARLKQLFERDVAGENGNSANKGGSKGVGAAGSSPSTSVSTTAVAASASKTNNTRLTRFQGGKASATSSTSSSNAILGASAGAPAPPQVRLWQTRDSVSFERFRQAFESRSANPKEYPLLAALLKEEQRLCLIPYIADVLAWHALLFEVVPAYSITREEANSITNAQIIDRLPKHRRPAAQQVLDRFCHGFNEAFPHITNLYECQANPFLNRDGGVDLSGSGVGNTMMNSSTPISFSLPSHLQGETDAQGLCTIQLINMLQVCHNELLAALGTLRTKSDGAVGEREAGVVGENDDNGGDVGFHVVSSAQANAGAKGKRVGAVDLGVSHEDRLLPSVNYQTPYSYVERLLIRYDRESRFMPLLRLWAVQQLEYGNGGSIEFDFKGIEAAFGNSIVGIAQPITVHIRLYSFSGEMQRSGLVTKLGSRLHQTPLSQAILASICSELNTQYQLVQLTYLLENCIELLVSTSLSLPLSFANTTLESYVLQTLLYEKGKWEDISSATLRQHVCLAHLQSLFLALEERVSGSGLDRVALKYRVPLTGEVESSLKKAVHHLNLFVLLPVLRDLLVLQLHDEQWQVGESLKAFLTFATEIDLESEDWFAR